MRNLILNKNEGANLDVWEGVMTPMTPPPLDPRLREC
jgi:hypothetical protein